MLTLKYRKTTPASYVSHVDVLKMMNRILRRADIETEYSQGFNPHMLLFFSPPTPVGIESVCEYVTIAAKDRVGFLERFNAVCPEGVIATDLFLSDKNPNLAHIVTSARYSIKGKGIGKLNVNEILDSETFVARYSEKGKDTEKEVRKYILAVERADDDTLSVALKFGNENLRADRFVKGLFQFFNLEETPVKIVKQAVFNNNGTPIDEMLSGSSSLYYDK
jgi:radical SAM-linked protein